MSGADVSGETRMPGSDCDLTAVIIYGRLKNISRRRLTPVLAARGGRTTRSVRKATLLVLAHSSAASVLSDRNEVLLPEGLPLDRVVSEGQFMSAIGLESRRRVAGAGPYGMGDVARTAALSPGVCRSLALFDLLRPVGGRFAYQDLATARQVAALLAAGVGLAEIVEAGATLEARGVPLSQARLVEAPWGGIAQRIGGQLAGLDGQMVLVLADEAVSAEECFARALTCEDQGDLDEAARWYAKAESVDRNDPILPFNRGNALAGAGKTKDAMLAYRQALARDPAFVEAAFNLAKQYEALGKVDEALGFYQAALTVLPSYSEALFNRARLLTASERYAEALPLWSAFVAVAPFDPDVRHARRLAMLCRINA